MNLQEIIERLRKQPQYIDCGKYMIAKRWKCTPEDFAKARIKVREELKSTGYKKVNIPKILILDIETLPMMAYVWRRWKQDISLDQTIQEWFMLCWSAKWLYESNIMSDILTPDEIKNQDDYRITANLWKLVDEADIVIAYNGKKADIPWINTRFILNNLNPPSSYILVDPCDTARKKFGFSSNKLDALAGYFNIKHKDNTSFELWKNCMTGDSKALAYMLKYNKNDVAILEEVYLRMRSWISNHPNITNFCNTDSNSCVRCGSDDIEIIPNKYYYTSVNRYQLYRCKSCGTVFRARKGINTHTEYVSTAK